MHRAGGLGRDRPAQGSPAPAHRPTPAMEEGDRHPRLLAHPRELPLRLAQLPVRGEEPAVLVGVGVPDHHFLHPTLAAHAPAHQRNVEQFAHHLGRTLQVIDGLEERDDGQGAALHRRLVGEEASLPGQEVHSQQVVHRVGHAQHERPDRLPVHRCAELGHDAEHAQCLRRVGREHHVGFPGTARSRQLRLQPRAPGGRRHVGRVLRGAPHPHAPEGMQRGGEAGRVLAEVEANGAEAEGLHLPAHGRHDAACQHLPGSLGHACLEGAKVGEERIGALIRRPRMGGVPGTSRGAGARTQGAIQPPRHACQELPEHLARVPRDNPAGIPRLLERLPQRLTKRRGDGDRAFGDAEPAHQFRDAPLVTLDRRPAILVQRAAGHLVGDERVAVTVPSHPGAELEERQEPERPARVVPGQGALEAIHQCGHGVEEGLVEEVQPPIHLLGHRGLLQAEFPRHPEQVDLLAELVLQGRAFPGCPARALEVHQPAIDAPVLLQHRDAPCLGGVGSDHRPDAQPLEERLERGCRHPGGARIRQDAGEGPAECPGPAIRLELAAPAHGGVLLGDAEQLEPDAVRVQGLHLHVEGEPGPVGRAGQEGLRLRGPDAHHLHQLVEQDFRDLGRVGGGAGCNGVGR